MGLLSFAAQTATAASCGHGFTESVLVLADCMKKEQACIGTPVQKKKRYVLSLGLFHHLQIEGELLLTLPGMDHIEARGPILTVQGHFRASA